MTRRWPALVFILVFAAGCRTAAPAGPPAPDPAARSGDGLGPVGTLASLARLYGLGALVRSGLHRRLVYANLSLDWFFEFQRYWVEELGNRPIHPHDFYFLAGVYRQRLQTIHFESLENPALASDDKHLEAWRDPRTIYYLFAHTFRLALSPLRVHPYMRYVPRGGRVAEYGCGAGPVLTALARRYRHLDLQLVGADIPQHADRDALAARQGDDCCGLALLLREVQADHVDVDEEPLAHACAIQHHLRPLDPDSVVKLYAANVRRSRRERDVSRAHRMDR